jgi:hypothetical protein
MSKSSRIQTSNKTEIWESSDIIEAFENTDLGQAVSADVDDITDVISENILEKLHEIYKLSGELTRNNTKNHFNTFQGLLRDFKDWDKKTINKFARKIRRNLSDIDNLLRSSIIGVCQIRFIWIAKTKGIGKRDCNRVLQAISLSRIIPTTENFLHWCCCRSAKEVYQYPYLFDNRKKISNHKIQENIKSIKNIICKAINDEIYSRENASYIIQHAVKYVKGGLSLLDDKEEENEQMVEEEENENINEDTNVKNKSENFENKIESKEILKDNTKLNNIDNTKLNNTDNTKLNNIDNTKLNNIEIENEHYVDETQKDIKVKESKKINNLLPILTPNKNKKKNKNLISIKLPEYDSEPDELLTKRKIIKRKSQKLKKDTNKDKISSNQYSKKTTIKNKIKNNISDNNFSNDDLKEINKNYKYNQEDNDEKQYWDNLKEDMEKNIEESDSSDNSELYLNANDDEDVDDEDVDNEDVDDEDVDDEDVDNEDVDDEDVDDEDVDDEDVDDEDGDRNENDDDEDDDDEDVDRDDRDEDDDDEDDDDEDDDDEDDDDEDDDDEDVDRDSFWKTLQNEAEKQLGFGRLEEEKNKRKSKTSKSLNKISSRKSKSYRNDLEMSDDDNKGDGIDIDTDED